MWSCHLILKKMNFDIKYTARLEFCSLFKGKVFLNYWSALNIKEILKGFPNCFSRIIPCASCYLNQVSEYSRKQNLNMKRTKLC